MSFSLAWFMWAQIHWKFLNDRNAELEKRSEFFASSCANIREEIVIVKKVNRNLAQQVYMNRRKKPGQKKYLRQLTKLIKERNFKYGIWVNNSQGSGVEDEKNGKGSI